MPTAPSLGPGLEAYRRGDWSSARVAWEGLAEGSEGDEATLLGSLALLAAGLEDLHSDRGDRGVASIAEVGRRLEPLPDRVLGVDVALLRAGCDHAPDRLAATPPPILRARRLPPGTMRFVIFMGVLLAGALIFRLTPLHEMMNREAAVELLGAIRGSVWAPVALMGAFVVLAPLGLPVSPLIMAGGLVFGIVKGALFNYVGALSGATLSYWLARVLGRDFIVQVAGSRLRRVEAMVSRHGFWSLAGIRLMPIPFPVANFGLALAGVRLPMFIGSTAVGLTPGVLMYTYLATVLAEAAETQSGGQGLRVIGAILLFTLVGLSPTLWRQRKRRLRYRELRRRRADRSREPRQG